MGPVLNRTWGQAPSFRPQQMRLLQLAFWVVGNVGSSEGNGGGRAWPWGRWDPECVKTAVKKVSVPLRPRGVAALLC